MLRTHNSLMTVSYRPVLELWILGFALFLLYVGSLSGCGSSGADNKTIGQTLLVNQLKEQITADRAVEIAIEYIQNAGGKPFDIDKYEVATNRCEQGWLVRFESKRKKVGGDTVAFVGFDGVVSLAPGM